MVASCSRIQSSATDKNLQGGDIQYTRLCGRNASTLEVRLDRFLVLSLRVCVHLVLQMSKQLLMSTILPAVLKHGRVLGVDGRNRSHATCSMHECSVCPVLTGRVPVHRLQRHCYRLWLIGTFLVGCMGQAGDLAGQLATAPSVAFLAWGVMPDPTSSPTCPASLNGGL